MQSVGRSTDLAARDGQPDTDGKGTEPEECRGPQDVFAVERGADDGADDAGKSAHGSCECAADEARCRCETQVADESADGDEQVPPADPMSQYSQRVAPGAADCEEHRHTQHAEWHLEYGNECEGPRGGFDVEGRRADDRAK